MKRAPFPLWVFSFSLALLLSVPARAQWVECVDPLKHLFLRAVGRTHFVAVEGVPSAWTAGGSAEVLKLLENSEYRKLGRGISGEVYRIIPPKPPPSSVATQSGIAGRDRRIQNGKPPRSLPGAPLWIPHR